MMYHFRRMEDIASPLAVERPAEPSAQPGKGDFGRTKTLGFLLTQE